MTRTASALAALLMTAPGAWGQPQWTAVLLQPPGALTSDVWAVNGQQQGGYVQTASGAHAALWSGSSAGWSSLGPGAIHGMWGTQCVGSSNGGAVLWDGPVQVLLGGTDARAVRDGMQVGYSGAYGPTQRALVWRGSAASMVELHPAGARGSLAWATDGHFQGGSVEVGTGSTTVHHAALWEGSAESFRDLNPGPGFHSTIYGMAPGQQVGSAEIEPAFSHAAVWNGTGASWQDFHPAGTWASSSVLYGTTGTEQVGVVDRHATIWFNAPDDRLDLSQFLPPGYYHSEATSVFRQDNTIFVGGWADNGNDRAVLWVGTVPAPLGASLLAGSAWAVLLRRCRPRS